MKKLRLWIAVDADGKTHVYDRHPEYDFEGSFFYTAGSSFRIAVLPSHAGQCWRQEIEAPPVAKKRGAVPPFAERGDEAALRKHEKEPFR